MARTWLEVFASKLRQFLETCKECPPYFNHCYHSEGASWGEDKPHCKIGKMFDGWKWTCCRCKDSYVQPPER
jgi:hypothetical protein